MGILLADIRVYITRNILVLVQCDANLIINYINMFWKWDLDTETRPSLPSMENLHVFNRIQSNFDYRRQRTLITNSIMQIVVNLLVFWHQIIMHNYALKWNFTVTLLISFLFVIRIVLPLNLQVLKVYNIKLNTWYRFIIFILLRCTFCPSTSSG